MKLQHLLCKYWRLKLRARGKFLLICWVTKHHAYSWLEDGNECCRCCSTNALQSTHKSCCIRPHTYRQCYSQSGCIVPQIIQTPRYGTSHWCNDARQKKKKKKKKKKTFNQAWLSLFIIRALANLISTDSKMAWEFCYHLHTLHLHRRPCTSATR